MKRVLVLFVALLSLSAIAKAGDKTKESKPAAKKEIEWLSFEEAEKRMKTEPRKVWIDIYTDWCGWCKVLDKKVFTNPDVVDYMNKKYYAIKFNAERRDSFEFAGKKWGYMPDNKVCDLAMQLTGGQLSYPTSVLMTENFQNPQHVAGYLPVPQIETIMKYMGDNTYINTKYEDYTKSFKPVWNDQQDSNNPMAPQGH